MLSPRLTSEKELVSKSVFVKPVPHSLRQTATVMSQEQGARTYLDKRAKIIKPILAWQASRLCVLHLLTLVAVLASQHCFLVISQDSRLDLLVWSQL